MRKMWEMEYIFFMETADCGSVFVGFTYTIMTTGLLLAVVPVVLTGLA